MFALLLLAACSEEKVADSGEPFLAELAPAWVGLYAAAAPGTFRSDCEMGVTLYESDVELAEIEMDAQGGQWTGLTLPGTALYKARAAWDTCTTGPEGTGEMDSSAFSGAEGDLFVFHFNGVAAAFDAMAQREDFEGGKASVTFVEGTTAEDAEALIAAQGASVTSSDGLVYEILWTDVLSVGEMLRMLTEDASVASAGPVWLQTPDWW